MNDDLSVLLKVILDSSGIGKSDISTIQKVLEKYTVNVTAELDKAQLMNSVKEVLPQVIKEISKISGTDIKIDIDDSLIEKSINQVSKEIDSLTSKANKIQLSTDVTKLTTDYQKFGVVSQKVEDNLKELKSAQQAVINAKGTDKLVSEIKKYDEALDKTNSSMKELTTTQVSLSKRTSQMKSMREWMRKNSAAIELCDDKVKELIAECETCDKVRFEGIKNEFKQIQVAAGEAGKLGTGFLQGLKEQGSKFIQWIGVSGAIMQTVQTAIIALI